MEVVSTSGMSSLDDLEEIRWESLSHAYGPAADIPRLFRQLETERSDYDEVWSELYASLAHQGTVYTASANAVPFLLRLLPNLRDRDRASALGLIAEIGTGRATDAEVVKACRDAVAHG